MEQEAENELRVCHGDFIATLVAIVAYPNRYMDSIIVQKYSFSYSCVRKILGKVAQ